MADFDSSLPIRTEAAGDVDIFISDATVSTQKLKVNADGSIDTNFAAGSKVIITDGADDVEVNADGSLNAVVTATDLDIRALTNADVVTIEDGGGSITVDGTVAATQSGTWDIGTVTTLTSITNDVNIADGGNSITVDAVDLDIRDLAFATDTVDVSGSSVTVSATNLDIRDLSAATDSIAAHLFDEAGVAYSLTNPLPVEMVSDSSGDEISNYNTSAAVAKNASVNHDYTVTAAKTFLGVNAWISGSGKLKVQVLVNGAVKFVGFNSTANPNVAIPMEKIVKAAATQVVRITITNLDNQAQDLYSTLLGLEI